MSATAEYRPGVCDRLEAEHGYDGLMERLHDPQWRARERQRCAYPGFEGLHYFVANYGSLEPPEGGPVPFELWPEQVDVLYEMFTEKHLWVLKARRLGLSWLGLHFAVWITVYATLGQNTRTVIICKTEGDAAKLLERCKHIIDRLPGWVKPAKVEADKSNSGTLRIGSTGCEILSLAATEGSARLETVTLLILDEFAFPINQRAKRIFEAALPTIEGGGRVVGISTGNGRDGDGETFATVWEGSQKTGDEWNGFKGIFLPWTVRPSRDEAWYAQQLKRFPDPDAFRAEYPATPEEALVSLGEANIYDREAITAAENIGRVLDTELELLVSAGVEIGGDWGYHQTFAVYGAALAGGGMFVVDELPLMLGEPISNSERILEHHPAGQPVGIQEIAFDLMQPGDNNVLRRVLAAYHAAQPDVFPASHRKINFGIYKQGGTGRKGVNTVGYIKHLLAVSKDAWDAVRDLPVEAQVEALEASSGILAIAPRCGVLLKQMRGLKTDPETGKVVKPIYSNNNPEKGDHGPDALVALMAMRARSFQPDRDEAEAA